MMCLAFYTVIGAVFSAIAEARWHVVAIALCPIGVWRMVSGPAQSWLSLLGRAFVSLGTTAVLVAPLAWLYVPELLGVRRGFGTTFFDAGCNEPIITEPGRGLGL